MLKNLFIASVVRPGMEKIKLKGVQKTKEVFLNGVLLSPKRSIKVRNYSDSFDWGYGESNGAFQLALAVLLECTGKKLALKHCNDFKWKIKELPNEEDFDVVFDIAGFIKKN